MGVRIAAATDRSRGAGILERFDGDACIQVAWRPSIAQAERGRN